MKLTDVKGWHEFLYSLFFPALLGSMLFDLLNWTTAPGTSSEASASWIFGAKVAIIIYYCADFLHLYVDLNSDDYRVKPEGRMVLYDGSIALLFGTCYWSIVAEAWMAFSIGFALIPVLQCLYPPPRHFVKPKNYDNALWGLVFAAIATSLFAVWFRNPAATCAGLIVVTLTYLVHVFWVCRELPSR